MMSWHLHGFGADIVAAGQEGLAKPTAERDFAVGKNNDCVPSPVFVRKRADGKQQEQFAGTDSIVWHCVVQTAFPVRVLR